MARFQTESMMMISINHPNVVKIKYIQLTAELPYIVMEFVEGGDVRSLLKTNGQLDIPTVIRLGLQMADALEAIHKLTIIHRDIKPDNIMYRVMSSGELHFLLTDFGISKVRGAESVTITGQSPMTLEYAFPDQFEDILQLTTATDYYSLGVVLYECLTGNVPFPVGTKGFGSYAKIVETQLPPVISLPKSVFLPEKLKEAINQLLVKQSLNRLNNSKQLKRMLSLANVELLHDENDEAIVPLDSYIKNNDKLVLKPEEVTNELNLAVEYLKQERYEKAFSICYKEAEKESDTAQYWLGYMFENGLGLIKDYIKAASWYQKAADQGHSESQYKLGEIYQTGLGVEKNYKTAVEWYEKAASNGNHKAQSRLGYLYCHGFGVDKNTEKALFWLLKAANQGDIGGQYLLGNMYQTGHEIVQDYKKAVEWYRKAAEQGDPKGQIELGKLYEKGLGVAQDQQLAEAWYRKAAEQGDPKGQIELGKLYEKGLGVAQDQQLAEAWYRKAAEQGDPEGQYFLGYFYHITYRYKEAIIWYKEAAKQGNLSAQNNIGVLYNEGYGVKQNKDEALVWFRKAADQGFSLAQYNLGLMYEAGHGVDKNNSKALDFYRLAAKQNNKLALDALKRLDGGWLKRFFS